MARLEELHDTIPQVINWMSTNISLWLTNVDRFRKVSSNVECEWYGWLKVAFCKG